jgi:hypothetical protein
LNDETKITGKWKWGWILPLAAFIAYALIKKISLNPALSDENIYFYMGKLVAEGNVPYRDFFYSGPPLLLYLLAIPGFFAPDTFLAYKIVPLLISSATVGCMAGVLQRAWGWRAAICGFLLLLCSSTFLKATSHATGINLAMLGTWAAFWLALCHRPRWAALALALGISGKILAITTAPALFLMIWWIAPRDKMKTLMTSAAVFGGTLMVALGPFLLLAPKQMWRGMVQYHLLKPARPERSAETISYVYSHNYLFWVIAGIALLVLVMMYIWSRSRTHFRFESILAVYLVVHLVFLLMQKRVFNFYFDPLVIVAAGLGGWLWWMMSQILAHMGERYGKNRRIMIEIAVTVSCYAVISVFFLSTSWGIYTKHESSDLSVAVEMAQYLREKAVSGETIFGDSGTASLVALLSGVPIAANEVDTNFMRFTSGISDLTAVLDRAKADNLTYIVVLNRANPGAPARMHGVASFREFKKLLPGNPARTYRNPRKGYFLIYEYEPK